MQKVVDEIRDTHFLILSKIKEYNIFDENQMLSSEEVNFANNSPEITKSIIWGVVFFEVIKNKVYFMLMDGMFICIYSTLLGSSDIDRDIRLNSIKSISFEKFLEIVPKEVSKKYLYHIDFFQEHLSVINL